MTELESKIWNMTHRWCDAQHGAIPDKNRRYLMDEIKALVLSNVSNWVAVDKELPVEVRRVLAIMSSGLVSVCYRWGDEWYMNDKGDAVEIWGYEVTHWMPLPEPPTKLKENE